MQYEEISLQGFVDEVKDVSFGSHPRKFCFVLGAGASRTSGIPSGQELVDAWDAELSARSGEEHQAWKKELGITKINKYRFYRHYYERRFGRHPSDGSNYLEHLESQAKPSSGYIHLAYLLSNTIHNVAITTNFDHLIEEATRDYALITPTVIWHEGLTHRITSRPDRPVILKIRPDLPPDAAGWMDESAPGAFSQFAEVETLADNWKKALDALFLDYHPVFIGYAGNDNCLMEYLRESARRFEEGALRAPYWMLYGDDKADGRVYTFLHKSSGYCIKHAGFDETLALLGAALGYQAPSKADFLREAERRYQALADALAAGGGEPVAPAPVTQGSPTPAPGDAPAIQDGESESPQTVALSGASAPATQGSPAPAPGGAPAIQDGESESPQTVALSGTSAPATQGSSTPAPGGAPAIQDGESESPQTAASDGDPVAPPVAPGAGQDPVAPAATPEKPDPLTVIRQAALQEPDNAGFQNSLVVILRAMERYDDELVDAARKAAALAPDNAGYHNNLAVILRAMERYEEALPAARKAAETDAENASYQNNLGVIARKTKRYREALAAARRAAALEPENAGYHNSLGIIAHAAALYDEALAAARRAAALEPENADYQNSLSVTLHALKQYDAAFVAARRAVALEPKNAEYQNGLSATLHAMERHEDALAAARRAVALAPDNAGYRSSLGITLRKMGLHEEAVAEKQKAVELEPENASYHNSLGISLYERKHYEEALSAARKTVELEPKNAGYHSSLGIALHKMKRYKEAFAEKQKAVELEPENIAYRKSLDLTLHKLGET